MKNKKVRIQEESLKAQTTDFRRYVAIMNLYHWHDLIETPEDLPNEHKKYLVKMKVKTPWSGIHTHIKIARYDSNGWHYPIFMDDDVKAKYIKWCEIPKDE